MLARREGMSEAAEDFLRGKGDHREDLKEMLQAALNGEI